MMTDFATILDELEELSRRIDPAKRFDTTLLAGVETRTKGVRPGTTKNRATFAAAAYETLSSDAIDGSGASEAPGRTPSPHLPDRERLIEQLRDAEKSIDDLRALRRKFAWLCHPDRHERVDAGRAEKLMAEFNARIDSAIEKLGYSAG